MIDVSNLSVRFGKIRAVQDASFTLSCGQLMTIVGLNGSGKTSLANAVNGLIPIAGGKIEIDRVDVTKSPFHQRGPIALVPEGRVLAPSLSIHETLRLGGGRISRSEFLQRSNSVLSLFPELGERLDQKAGSLSGGEASLLSFARALMRAPKYLVLDEPTLGLSPAATKRVFETIADLRNLGLGILLIEQNLQLAISGSDLFYLMRDGRLSGCHDAFAASSPRQIENLLFKTEG
ncbi:MAG: ATP-binding cassette domain-containing protein [Proteobacteria bacterium]|nr:ATP-binding cassette domain-containing protein [Pseudomonadota bacterium]MDA0849709.1 ATP-binding cassette domain-containing protein [Pseudomonadota bacterium]MDA1295966.1 ATP-binding cassette domain-containing protein [Pseudomonadota bacterium]